MAEQETKETDFYFDLLLVGLVIVVAALSIFAFFNAEKQYYTELYFKPESLPKTARAGQALSFSFFVENHEGKMISYSFTVSAEGETKAQKTIELANNEKKQVAEEIVFKKPSAERQKVLVELKKPESTQPYSVFFWVDASS